MKHFSLKDFVGFLPIRWRNVAGKPVTIGTLFLCLTNFAYGQGKENRPVFPEMANARNRWVEDTLKGLSLEEKVGQMLQVQYYARHWHHV
jgi:hypothetical protein